MREALIIEDDFIVQESITIILEAHHFNVFQAPNGEVGIRLMEHNHFDVIITDIIMPVKEGLQTIKEAKQRWPYLKIIAISSGGSEPQLDYLTAAKLLGVDATLRKPIDADDLMACIDKLISKSPPDT
ncbi:response regulator receiver protein [Magnetococcus marinus MC-1]|uniref:Response regulator receiver protein n=1 Tax=Magnetococcus marinus (strain ATCC BAA-1437 / JCM 17883 / MC-1) TaxID=156889 RepID=A0L5Q4_MAGMM|nr:response regulator [Magnetococcus marinus]ABK43297.1 response regulator receiver protein [Magnetococcus marinus MC-1]